MLRTCIIAAALLANVADAAIAHEGPPSTGCTAIRFVRGTSSATVNGMAKTGEQSFTCYLLATGRGQTATLTLTKANEVTAFTIPDVVDNRTTYSFRTEARSYQIDVYQMSINRGASGRPAPFTLQVSVN